MCTRFKQRFALFEPRAIGIPTQPQTNPQTHKPTNPHLPTSESLQKRYERTNEHTDGHPTFS